MEKGKQNGYNYQRNGQQNSYDYQRNGHQNSYQKNGPRCYHCSKNGHIKRNCPKLTNKNEERRTFRQENANNITETKIKDTDSSDSDYGFMMVSHALLSNSVRKNNWIIDSGATSHMCNDKMTFLNIKVFREPREVQVGDGSSVKVIGEGMINLKIELEYGKVRKCRLLRVLYVPDLAYNLLSVSKATYIT